MDNDDAKHLLLQIRRMCLEHYPYKPGDEVHLTYCSAFGFIAGLASEALQAVAQGRLAHFDLDRLQGWDDAVVALSRLQAADASQHTPQTFALWLAANKPRRKE